ncbi:hypothetical protein GGQ84_000080 [Desulfitispora alkaliphila]|uniref:DUF166 domain-containing protein n=1 Tax=Desulfitispora alkaliphila TaxID=622674 RepID=UPI003D235701
MHILALVQGVYGERIVSHIQNNLPQSWRIQSFTVPSISLAVVDDPDEFLPQNMDKADLILHLAEAQQAAQLLTAVVEKTGAKAVIASIDNGAWIPLGLRNQLKRELEKEMVDIVFPEPFCSLTESTAGFGDSFMEYSSETASQFARYFGKPVLDVQLDSKTNKITGAKIKRGAPCGSTQYTVNRMKGYTPENVTPHAGLMCLHYPCLASMEFINTSEGVDTIMHLSGKVFNEAVERSLTAQGLID